MGYIMLSKEFLFGDHQAKTSKQAKLYYVALMFEANYGFVANPMQVLDNLGYDKSVFDELVANEEILTLNGRSEIFITSYFIHNHNFKVWSWRTTPYAQYWCKHLHIKKNGVATFKPLEKGEEMKEKTVKEQLKLNRARQREEEKEQFKQEHEQDDPPQTDNVSWDSMMEELDAEHHES